MTRHKGIKMLPPKGVSQKASPTAEAERTLSGHSAGEQSAHQQGSSESAPSCGWMGPLLAVC